MKVRELIDILAKADPEADVELVVDEMWDLPYTIEDVDPRAMNGTKVFIVSEPR